MLGNRRRDTAPEKALRSAVHRLGLRFRVAARPAATTRTADLVFSRARVAVFMDGCYWHGCPEHFTPPRTNPDYWREKIGRNVSRDRDTNEQLTQAGWIALRIWEHEPVNEAAQRVATVVRASLGRGARPHAA
jgi:DNA mismatch endonuclease (patch repair protein)